MLKLFLMCFVAVPLLSISAETDICKKDYDAPPACCICDNCKSCPDGFEEGGSERSCQTGLLNDTSDDNDTSSQNVSCLRCDSGHFLDQNSNKTKCCSKACLNCTGQGNKNCLKCAFTYNGECVERCPGGTKLKTENGNKSCENEEDNNELIIIIAASAGGGVVVIAIVVIVIVVCCCCRRADGTTPSSRMSRILQSKKPGDDPEVGGAKPSDGRSGTMGNTNGNRPHAYENTAVQPELAEGIQQQNDQVLRYTRDPTSLDRKQKLQPDEYKDEDVYANQNMIRLNQNIDTTNASTVDLQHHLQEMEETAELGTAPAPPSGVQMRKKVEVPTPSRKENVLVRLSRRFTKKKSKAADADKVDDGLYKDMSGTEKKVNKVNTVEDKDLEDYENVPKKKSKVGKGGSRNPTRKAPAVHTAESGELEDYENMKDVKLPGMEDKLPGMEDYMNVDIKDIKTKNTKKKRRDAARQQQPSDNELEMYENSARGNAEAALEDYENVDFSQLKTKGKVNLDDMEDYENASQFRK